MPLILHLSDLHLLPPDVDEEIGDYKAEIVPKGERQTRVSLLRNTLRGLRLSLQATGETLDSIVISGDITYQGHPDGLDLLPNLLSELGSSLPVPSRIVAVPGNHDVGFGTAPGSAERYDAFVGKIRGQGYVTPRLDGVDENATHAIFESDGYVIVALNSCDYSVAVEPLDPDAQHDLDDLVSDGKLSDSLARELRRLRLHDAARINGSQLRAVADALLAADPEDRRLRIATFHHHLLPVSLNEEVKTFESFSNLGEIRNFLADSHIDMVLHGHKHVGRVFTDSYASLHEEAVPDQEHACLIVSCGTIGAQVGVGQEVAKLIRVDSRLPRTRRVAITSLPALGAGASLPENLKKWDAPIRSPVSRTHDQLMLRGRRAADVHEALEDLYANEAYRGALICVMEESVGDDTPPPTYPKLDLVTNLEDWFAGQVRWWQSDSVAEGKPFTHGDYIRRWRGHRDQLTEVVDALRAAPQTSRAVVTLFDPPGALDDQQFTFPSFTMLAFKLRGDRLDATAFFRKQEMRYWWPINVAEIAKLLDEVASRVSHSRQRVIPGGITTVTSEVVFSEAAPKVAVPVIDQLAWRETIQLTRLATAVFDPEMPERDRELQNAEAMFLELMPPLEMPQDGPYVSVAGPAALLGILKGLSECYQNTGRQPADLIARLEALVDKNTANAGLAAGDGGTEAYQAWQETTSALVREIVAALKARQGTPAG